jgi:uncharacterized protein (DUF302 family)
MAIREIAVQRFSRTSKKSVPEVVAAMEKRIGRPDMATFRKQTTAAKNYAELEQAINAAVGSTGLMEFTRFDLGEILRKETGASSPHIVRLVVGNPLIMKRMVEYVPDAGSYAPVTILIDEREDGTHLSYDRMASFLAPYGNAQALQVAKDLDAKVEALLTAAAADDK